jgi:hypothetical protein
MNWKPKDWSVDKIVIECVKEHGLPKLSIGNHYQSLVEAGADAMLPAAVNQILKWMKDEGLEFWSARRTSFRDYSPKPVALLSGERIWDAFKEGKG